MPEPFRRFVIFAGMRTGSNLLEATLNAIKRVTCFGEAFNPYMLGWPGKDELKGITLAQREAEPMALLAALWDKPNHLPGFRYFHDHDPRVLEAILDDPLCAKIILTRNPLDSYVSTRLAWETNQWKLNETETPIAAVTSFDPAEFRDTLAANEAFQRRIMERLQVTGQAGFWLRYEDLRSEAVMTGLLHWLGRTDLERVVPASDQVPQNPREMAEKVANFDEMKAELARLDPYDLYGIPLFEPARGPAVPGYLASEAGDGLLFMPVRGGPTERVAHWFAALGATTGDFTQNGLRQWKRGHPGHRSFSVLRHPVLRAYEAYRAAADTRNPMLREALAVIHRVPLAEPGADLPDARERDIFLAFLDFLRRNLNGQTRLPTQPGWASQSEVLAGYARFNPPDMLIREDRLARDLPWLAQAAGRAEAPPLPPATPPRAFLSEPAVLQAARAAYQRDYTAFGFRDTF